MVGRVEQVVVYPVKSLAGAPRDAVEVRPAGLAGDRAYAVVDAHGRAVRPKDAPAMRAVAATGDPAADGARLSAVLGRAVRVEPSPPAPGTAAVHLVSRRAVLRAAEGEVPEGCSAEDPRANLVLALGEGVDERTWVGRQVRVGEAVLRVSRLPKHCLGVYAEVARPGPVRVGDAVLLDPEEPAP